jgi:hypothetical protein
LNIAIILVSCKPKENLFLLKSPEKLNDKELEEIILKANKEIETVKLGRINISLDINGEEFKSGGTIGIIRDSVVVISLVPAMGYEISRIFCYKDKVLVLDRVEKTFFYTSLQKNIEKYKIHCSYNDIEALLEGRAFVYGNEMYGAKMKKSLERIPDKIKINYDLIQNEKIITSQEIIVREEGLLTENNNIKDHKENTDISLNYDEFSNISGFILPQKIILLVDNPDRKLKLLMEIGNIVINEQINADNTIPSRYQEAIMDY